MSLISQDIACEMSGLKICDDVDLFFYPVENRFPSVFVFPALGRGFTLVV